MKSNRIIATGFFILGMAVAINAFGAHALKPLLARLGTTETFSLAGRYMFIHGTGLLLLGICQIIMTRFEAKLAFWLMLVGMVLFSGSLLLLALTGQKWLGAITPFGGALLIGSWLLAAWQALRS